jgi:protein-disulfide isomerase
MMTRIGSLLLLLGMAAGLIWMGRKTVAAGPIDSDWARANEVQLRRVLNLRPNMQLQYKKVLEDPEAPQYYVVQFDLITGDKKQTLELYVTRDGKRILADREYDLADPFRSVREQISLEGAAAMGPAEAPLTIVEYLDYNCGYCRLFYQNLEKDLLARYQGRTRFVIKHFPILSPSSNDAARGSVCAWKQGEDKFWALHGRLFEEPKRTREGKAGVLILAADAGLNVGALGRCMDEEETKQAVQRDFEEGQKLGVSGTPNFFLNGRRLGGYVAPEGFFRIVEEELQFAPPAAASSQ